MLLESMGDIEFANRLNYSLDEILEELKKLNKNIEKYGKIFSEKNISEIPGNGEIESVSYFLESIGFKIREDKEYPGFYIYTKPGSEDTRSIEILNDGESETNAGISLKLLDDRKSFNDVLKTAIRMRPDEIRISKNII